MEEKKLFKVTSNPILRTGRGTQQIMLDVIIGLIPALAVGVYMFGAKAAMLLAVSIVSCVFFEWAYRKLMKKNTTVGDLSAVVTAILLVCVLPSEAKWWMVVIGSFFSVVVVKQLYGGIGKNFLNPALAGRAFLTAAYAGYMTVWAVPSVLSGSVDAATMATPLSYLYAGQPLPEYMGLGSIFLGSIPGCIGEISTLAVLIGGIWLLARKVITWRIHRLRRGPLPHLRPRGLRQDRLDAPERLLRRPHARRLLHGDRLLHQPRHPEGPAGVRPRLRRAHRAHPLLRLLPRGRQLRDTHHELLHLGR